MADLPNIPDIATARQALQAAIISLDTEGYAAAMGLVEGARPAIASLAVSEYLALGQVALAQKVARGQWLDSKDLAASLFLEIATYASANDHEYVVLECVNELIAHDCHYKAIQVSNVALRNLRAASSELQPSKGLTAACIELALGDGVLPRSREQWAKGWKPAMGAFDTRQVALDQAIAVLEDQAASDHFRLDILRRCFETATDVDWFDDAVLSTLSYREPVRTIHVLLRGLDETPSEGIYNRIHLFLQDHGCELINRDSIAAMIFLKPAIMDPTYGSRASHSLLSQLEALAGTGSHYLSVVALGELTRNDKSPAGMAIKEEVLAALHSEGFRANLKYHPRIRRHAIEVVEGVGAGLL